MSIKVKDLKYKDRRSIILSQMRIIEDIKADYRAGRISQKTLQYCAKKVKSMETQALIEFDKDDS